MITHSREVPVVENFDVIIVGAGPAGIMAAIAASTNGVKTLLIERYGFVGGSLTNSLVAPSQVFSVFGNPIVGGFARRLMDRLASSGNAIYPELEKTHGDWRGLTYWDPEILGVRFDPEALKNEALDMLLESGVNIRFHTTVLDYIPDSRTIVTYSKSGYQAFQAKVVIDCSGDGDIAEMAGCDFQKGEPGDDKDLQPPTLMMRLGGVDYEVARQYRPSFPEIIKNATQNGDLSLKREDLLFYRGTVKAGECVVNCSRVYRIDGTDVLDLTQAEIEGRRQNVELLKFFKKYVPGFQNAYLIDMAPQVGIRETRRIIGEYTLHHNDVLDGKQFSDTIALSYWPIDKHRSDGPGTVLDFPAPEVITRIPYRCLIPLGSDSLLVAGRCISTTREAFASIRVSATAMAIGQAAGTAAALAVQNDVGVKDISIAELQDTLRSQAAIIR